MRTLELLSHLRSLGVRPGPTAEVLGLERSGARDSFLEPGGHPLLATQVVSRVWDRLKVEKSLRTLLETPTISGPGERADMVGWVAEGAQRQVSTTDDEEDGAEEGQL